MVVAYGPVKKAAIMKGAERRIKLLDTRLAARVCVVMTERSLGGDEMTL
jgi:hypothetical protein